MDDQNVKDIKKVIYLFTNAINGLLESLGMIVANQNRITKGESAAYDENDFLGVLNDRQFNHDSLMKQSNIFSDKIKDEDGSNKVNIHFKVDESKAQYIFNAKEELSKAGIEVVTGGLIKDDCLEYDWEFNGSSDERVKVYLGEKD